jgi:hypothetical protein
MASMSSLTHPAMRRLARRRPVACPGSLLHSGGTCSPEVLMTVRVAMATCVLVLAGVASACGGSEGSEAVAPGKPSDQGTTAAPTPKCATNARCYSFATSDEGWPDVNDDNHFAGRDPYLDGSYRIGARETGSWSLTAPVKISDISSDYAVQIDTDATMSKTFPDDAAWGATCWTRPVPNGQIAGFGVYVLPKKVSIGLFDQSSGDFKPLKSAGSDGLVKPGKKSHLTMTCHLDATSDGPDAVVNVQINGKPTLAVSYPKSVNNYDWQPADGVGLLAAGKGADVFYDNVEIAGN